MENTSKFKKGFVLTGTDSKIGKNCLFPQHLRFGNTYRFTKLGKEKS